MLAKYYSIVVIFYIIELILFSTLLYSFENILFLNTLIRGLFVIISSIIIKKRIFNNSKYFYQGYYLLATLNPFFSTLLILIITKLFGGNIILIKFLADLTVSLMSFNLLKKI